MLLLYVFFLFLLMIIVLKTVKSKLMLELAFLVFKVQILSLELIFILFLSRFAHLRLIDVNEVVMHMPLTMPHFSRLVLKNCKETVQHLREVWIPKCAALISEKREDVEEWMPYNEVCCRRSNCLVSA